MFQESYELLRPCQCLFTVESRNLCDIGWQVLFTGWRIDQGKGAMLPDMLIVWFELCIACQELAYTSSTMLI